MDNPLAARTMASLPATVAATDLLMAADKESVSPFNVSSTVALNA